MSMTFWEALFGSRKKSPSSGPGDECCPPPDVMTKETTSPSQSAALNIKSQQTTPMLKSKITSTIITPEVAEHLLSPVAPSWKAFWFNQGPVVSSLPELAALLPKLQTKTFNFHINRKKNDLVVWIRECIGDAELAQKLSATVAKAAVAKLVSQRVNQLKKANQ